MNETPVRPPAERLKVGLLSFAHPHAMAYVRALRDDPSVDLVTTDTASAGAADAGADAGAAGAHGEDAARGAQFAEQMNVPYLDGVQAVLDWGPDVVVIASENVEHHDLALAAINAGAHVLCEKPLATTDADARAMVAAAQAAGVYLMTAYPVRFHDAFTDLLARVRAGQLGQIVSIHGTNNGKMPLAQRSWFTDPARSGGGALVDHVVHVADLIDEILGEVAQEVYAVTNRILRADAGRDVETGGVVSVRYPSGVIATIDCSWSVPDSAPTWGGLTLEVHGTAGSVRIDPFANALTGFGSGGPVHTAIGADLDARMIAEFLDAVRSGRPPRPDGSVGMRTLAVVTAAQRSAQSGLPQPVRVR